jgi:hypothetical protein
VAGGKGAKHSLALAQGSLAILEVVVKDFQRAFVSLRARSFSLNFVARSGKERMRLMVSSRELDIVIGCRRDSLVSFAVSSDRSTDSCLLIPRSPRWRN